MLEDFLSAVQIGWHRLGMHWKEAWLQSKNLINKGNTEPRPFPSANSTHYIVFFCILQFVFLNKTIFCTCVFCCLVCVCDVHMYPKSLFPCLFCLCLRIWLSCVSSNMRDAQRKMLVRLQQGKGQKTAWCKGLLRHWKW